MRTAFLQGLSNRKGGKSEAIFVRFLRLVRLWRGSPVSSQAQADSPLKLDGVPSK